MQTHVLMCENRREQEGTGPEGTLRSDKTQIKAAQANPRHRSPAPKSWATLLLRFTYIMCVLST